MPPPPPASGLASRLFLGPALRAQPDRRLVRLFRDGYENAFEEIVRRYDRGLRRYAAAIVPAHRADDVAQETFQKALLALRTAESDVELRPWLFRILRNTALNDLRDQPPPAGGVPDHVPGTENPAAVAERHEEITDLMRRLRSLPDAQRTAIVMRELEGLSHEEIAAALGVTGGAARQMLYRARRALRDAGGALTPAPLLQYLLAGAPGGTAVGEAAAGAGLGAAGLAGSGALLKVGMATVLVAGSVGAGVVVSQEADDERRRQAIEIIDQSDAGGQREDRGDATTATFAQDSGGSGSGSATEADHGGGSGSRGGREGSGSGSGSGSTSSGPGPGSDSSGSGGDGGGTEDHSGSGSGGTESDDHSGSDGGGGGHSGPGGGGDDDIPVISAPTDLSEVDDSPNSGPGSTSSGSGSSGSGTSGSGSSGSGTSGRSGSGSSGGGDLDGDLGSSGG